jgi:uncharacterized protein (TIRG00374 family)
MSAALDDVPPRDAMKARAALAGLLGVLVAVALVAWTLDRAGGTRFLDPLVHIAPWVLAPALACEVTVWISKAWKWTGLLASIQPVRVGRALAAIVVGGAATHLVPLRLDELLRARVLGESEGIPSATVLATVAVDRVVEILVLGSLIGGITLLGAPVGPLAVGLQVALAAFLLGVLGLAGFVFAERRITGLLARVSGPLARPAAALGRMGAEMAHGLRALPRGAALGRVLVGTLGEWGATIVLYVLVLRGFGIAAPPTVPLTLAVGGAAAYGVPNVPGAIGTFEATQVTLLDQLLSLPPEQALAIAVAAHAVLTVPVTLVGAGVGLSIWLRHRA